METFEIVAPACGAHCENLRLYGEHKANCGWEAGSVGVDNIYQSYADADAAVWELIDIFGWEGLRVRKIGEAYPS